MKAYHGVRTALALITCTLLAACPADEAATTDGDVESDAGGSGSQITHGEPSSISAAVVGGWVTTSSSCASDWDLSFFLCPGEHILGGGMIGRAVEVDCGTYSTSPATFDDCADRFGCFDKVTARVRSVLALAGEEDVDPAFEFALYHTDDDRLLIPAPCSDESSGYLVLERVSGEVTEEDCRSETCDYEPSASGGHGSCESDCDCGRCWYCESGSCRAGGEGPYGCYRGCEF